MSAIQQLTLSTDLIRSLIEAGALFPQQKVRLMSASGTWQIVTINELMSSNIQLISETLNAMPDGGDPDGHDLDGSDHDDPARD